MKTQKQTSTSYTDYSTPTQPEQRDTAPRKSLPDHAAPHSPITEREAKLLALRERDAIEHDSLLKAYHETRNIEDKLRNELDEAHNDTFKAKAHAERLAEALKKLIKSTELNGQRFSIMPSCGAFAEVDSALAAWEGAQS